MYDAADPGFGVIVSKTGAKSFFLDYTPPSGGRQRRRIVLNRYGIELTLEQARAEAPRSLVEVKRHLRRACEAFGNRRLADLDTRTVEAWRDCLCGEHGVTEASKSLSTVKASLTPL